LCVIKLHKKHIHPGNLLVDSTASWPVTGGIRDFDPDGIFQRVEGGSPSLGKSIRVGQFIACFKRFWKSLNGSR
jgi:hypothetical protein